MTDGPYDRYDDSLDARLHRAASIQDWSDGEMLWDLVVDAKVEIEKGRQWEAVARRRETALRRGLGRINAALDNSRIPMACWHELTEARQVIERELADPS